jgi:hypothetical protein
MVPTGVACLDIFRLFSISLLFSEIEQTAREGNNRLIKQLTKTPPLKSKKEKINLTGSKQQNLNKN